ncbi:MULTISPECIES: hypothetical protein [unclassified Streptomyces]|uniref:hypothetical protein n=1 Tax=unclassified Streptomyces TaxID=2593676 RepID=UPI0033179529
MTSNGLLNQGWKDSYDGVNFADGSLAEPPIALCEVQSYVYAAYVVRSHFAHEAGDLEAVDHWRGRAAALKEAFNERFWLPERGCYAVGLDGDKCPIDALASNMGHCLWTGIACIRRELADVRTDVARHELGRGLSRTAQNYPPQILEGG